MTRLQRCLRPALLATSLLLAGCSSLIGGPRETPTIYAPEPARRVDPSWPAVDWSLALARSGEAQMEDGPRIVVSPVPGELQVYRGALWARTPAEMVQDAVLRTLEDSGKLPLVARQGSGLSADYRLLLEVRAFRAEYAGSALPAAVVEVNATLLHLRDQSVAGSRNFRQSQPATGVAVAEVADAFSQALAGLSHDVAGWSLQAGQAHAGQPHPSAPAR
ncbi:ABC-type transport auxiliary lipoprotein family protein [Thermomonas sp. XSG]|jgi:cholesterol transport system auxiliary component|uniref:ABC-type transport auxiliary lipoprotein family protein n=1 Tax=Thermomonas sp. XSG TaxID=2771436 RepID=UPI001680E2CD|nr:ABC-type transport auxiliary lipoprotein family protein [Thermomonas sp. XSG]QNU15399.1 ABC transporter [Thermomonas sp. XSG]